MNILDILEEKNIINKATALKIQKKVSSSGKTLEQVLEEEGITPAKILEVKRDYYNIPTQDLAGQEVPFSVLKYVSEDAATHYQFVPLALKDGTLEIGLMDPENIEARDAITFIVGKLNLPYKIYLISEKDFKKVISSYKGLSGEVKKALTELDTELAGDASGVEILKGDKLLSKEEEQKIVEDAPVTKIVATILRFATEGNASDVHIESLRDKIRVRFRVDGVLHTSLVLPKEVHLAVVARIKILSNLRLDEKRKPQDGRFSASIDGRKIDFRVSTFPSYYGEKVVMRILDQERGVRTLEQMGLSERYMKMVKEAMDKPYGLILISGPTGSGKSTTLYAMLNEMDKDTQNVLSLEDPIEYSIDGISQSQVFPEIGYDFANGLRTTLRQDPDIIMVGEIRDKETAQLAVQAALTGHLVLSTIHTNTACGVIPRLIDMGVDPYLISPVLVLAMAQRLVTKLCPGTGKEIGLSESTEEMVAKQFADLPAAFRKEIPTKLQMYEPEVTPQCPNGTEGRIAVFEMFTMNPEIEKLVLHNPVESEIYKVARQHGLITMKEDAMIKAMNKIIPFGEMNDL
ncbi:MAG: GspE/PulE family protein [Candidatus Paceibacterota bacterium]|jgi:type IV pilus assembly protein PilB